MINSGIAMNVNMDSSLTDLTSNVNDAKTLSIIAELVKKTSNLDSGV